MLKLVKELLLISFSRFFSLYLHHFKFKEMKNTMFNIKIKYHERKNKDRWKDSNTTNHHDN